MTAGGTDDEKERLFQQMPHLRYGTDVGEMQFWCNDGEWTWKHVDRHGNVLDEGRGGP
jgi:hypothetical protein